MVFEMRGVRRTFVEDERVEVALDAVDLRIDLGEFVAISGPPGSGKTSLMQILGLLDLDFSGRFLFAGQAVRTMDDGQRRRLRLARIGFVFQGSNLLSSMTVLDNVALPCRQLNGNRDRARARAAEVLGEMRLAHLAMVMPRQLGAAEQQEVALARALVNDPWALLADEPAGHLDVSARHRVLDRLQSFHRRGRTVIIASADRATAGYAQRVLDLDGGRIESPEDSRNGLPRLAPCCP